MTSKSTQNRHGLEIDDCNVKIVHTMFYIAKLDVWPMSCYSLAPHGRFQHYKTEAPDDFAVGRQKP